MYIKISPFGSNGNCPAAGYPCGIKRLESETSFDAFAVFCQPPPAPTFFKQHFDFARQARLILALRRKESDLVVGAIGVAEGSPMGTEFRGAAVIGAVGFDKGFKC